MHDLAKNLPPLLMKGGEYDQEDFIICNKELSEHEIRVSTKDRLPTSIQYEFEDKCEDFFPNPRIIVLPSVHYGG